MATDYRLLLVSLRAAVFSLKIVNQNKGVVVFMYNFDCGDYSFQVLKLSKKSTAPCYSAMLELEFLFDAL